MLSLATAYQRQLRAQLRQHRAKSDRVKKVTFDTYECQQPAEGRLDWNF